MSSNVSTKYYAIDSRTGVTYGLKLDAAGTCTALQQMTTAIRNKDGVDSLTFEPSKAPEPFGETRTAIEISDSPDKQVFTMVWPSEEDFNNGKRPVVTKKDLPQDLIEAGIAPIPLLADGTADMDAAVTAAMKDVNRMPGLDVPKDALKRVIWVEQLNQTKKDLGIASKPASRHMLFTGGNGMGKKTFASETGKVFKALGFITKDIPRELTRADLVTGIVNPGMTPPGVLMAEGKDGLLLIDLSKAGDGGDGTRPELVNAILGNALAKTIQDLGEGMVVVLAGSEEDVRALVNANDALKSYFITSINFEDYTLPQLGDILDLKVQDRGFKLEADAREYAMNVLKDKKEQKLANGTVVHNIVEKAQQELADRLGSTGVLKKGNAGLTKEKLTAALTTLTLADIKAAVLALDPKVAPSKGWEFETAAKQDSVEVPAVTTAQTVSRVKRMPKAAVAV